MTAEKLYGILTLLDDLDKRLSLQESLESVAAALSNLASNPAQAQQQTSLAQSLNSLETAATRLKGEISPSQATAIHAMGGGDGQDGEAQEALAGIDNLAKVLRFPQVTKDPMLLESGAVIEGELRTSKHTKKTTTQKTATRKVVPST